MIKTNQPVCLFDRQTGSVICLLSLPEIFFATMDTTSKYTPIKLWAEDDRPREKLLTKGRQALSDAELLAILISTGSKNESAVDLSKRILKSANDNLLTLSRFSVAELKKLKGIGEAKAITIIAALELGRRRGSEPLSRTHITCSKDSYKAFHVLNDLDTEQFWVLLLNRANRLVHRQQVSLGGSTGTVVEVKQIIKFALDWRANSIVLGHNHPSGNINPSEPDKNITQKIKQAALLFDIQVLDHIIVGENAYFSFADEGEL